MSAPPVGVSRAPVAVPSSNTTSTSNAPVAASRERSSVRARSASRTVYVGSAKLIVAPSAGVESTVASRTRAAVVRVAVVVVVAAVIAAVEAAAVADAAVVTSVSGVKPQTDRSGTSSTRRRWAGRRVSAGRAGMTTAARSTTSAAAVTRGDAPSMTGEPGRPVPALGWMVRSAPGAGLTLGSAAVKPRGREFAAHGRHWEKKKRKKKKKKEFDIYKKRERRKKKKKKKKKKK
jgi:hypothetical protein